MVAPPFGVTQIVCTQRPENPLGPRPLCNYDELIGLRLLDKCTQLQFYTLITESYPESEYIGTLPQYQVCTLFSSSCIYIQYGGNLSWEKTPWWNALLSSFKTFLCPQILQRKNFHQQLINCENSRNCIFPLLVPWGKDPLHWSSTNHSHVCILPGAD